MEKLVDIEPKREFVFSVKDTTSAKCTLEITSKSSENVAFKIKTTAPKNYVVKPNTGVIQPSKAVTIHITLTPIPPSVKDHKFMLQTVKTDMNEKDLTPATVTEFWNKVKSMDKSLRDDYKLKVQLKSSDTMDDNSSMPVIQEDPQPEETKIEQVEVKQSSNPSDTDKPVVETIIVEEEEVKDITPSRDTSNSLYKTTVEAPKPSANDIQKQYTDIKKEISDKELELKQLKDKEMQDDKSKSLRASQPVGPAHRGPNARAKQTDGQFPLLYLILAIFGGLIMGMLSAYMIF
jgi:hypothetical protein